MLREYPEDPVKNNCPLCGNDCDLEGQEFSCPEKLCGIKFTENGLGWNFAPAQFEVGQLYRLACVDKRGNACSNKFEVTDKRGSIISIVLDDTLRFSSPLLLLGARHGGVEVECFKLLEELGGQLVFPYYPTA